MTVQELYDLTGQAGHDPRKVELFLAEGVPTESAPMKGDAIGEVEFDGHPERRHGWHGAYLVEEGSIHL